MPTNDATEALEQLRAKQAEYQLYCDYYGGRHRLMFATDKFRNAFGRLFKEFAVNHCPSVVDAVVDRLELTGFGVESGKADPAAEQSPAWRIWTANRMDLRAGQVHREALRAGDSYVLVWPRKSAPREPVLYPQKARLITVKYDEEEPGQLLWAAKAWLIRDPADRKRKRVRLNLYYPDRIEKYWGPGQTDETLPEKADSFERFELAGEAWPLPNEYGRVPVFHFANNADVGECGVSELANVIPLQDALNKTVMDMLVGMEYVALPQRWATGIQPEVDEETGRLKPPFTPGVERLWLSAAPDGKFGEFPQASLEQFLKVQGDFRLDIARVSSTPAHYMALITDPPSGEALKTLEARFTKKSRHRQTAFGNTWEDALAFALQISGESVPDRQQLAAQWVDPAPRSEKEHAETVAIKQGIGIPLTQALKELGYPEREIEAMVVAKQQERNQEQVLGAAALLAFERGQGTDEE